MAGTENRSSSRDREGRLAERQKDAGIKLNRDPSQVHDSKGEAQNVNDDTGRPLDKEESEKARKKATEGLRQDRNDS